MPPLPKIAGERKVELPARLARLAAETEVLVVGGGPAGLGAAVGAAKAGASVVLVERYGFLGGHATVALVMPLASFHTSHPNPVQTGGATLFPTDHGPGQPVIAGALKEFLERLVMAGGAIPPSLDTGYVVPFDPEIFKLTALQWLDSVGVKYLFHAQASGVLGSGRLEGVILETKSGPLLVKARTVSSVAQLTGLLNRNSLSPLASMAPTGLPSLY